MSVRTLNKLIWGVRTAGELVVSIWRGPHWWVVPVVLLLLPVAVILVVVETAPIVGFFVYTIL